MNQSRLLVGIVLFCATACGTPPPPVGPSAAGSGNDADSFVLARGALAEVAAERALFDDGRPIGGDRFFVRIAVRNRGSRMVWVDLRDRWRVFYPNQWSRSDRDHRLGVDERRLTVVPLGAVEREDLIKASRSAGVLVPIPPGQEVDYFIAFDGPRGADLDGAGAFLIVSLDGQVRLTDGAEVEQLRLGDDPTARDLVVPRRVRSRPIPAGARVLGPR